MNWVQGIEKRPNPERPLYLALGNFDGVHRGHQLIINRTVDRARLANGLSAVLVFTPHPQALFNPGRPFPLLTALQIKAELMAALGIDYFIVQPFSYELASTSPERFVNYYLWEKLRVSGVTMGEDYSFGRKGEGTPRIMARLGKKYGFEAEVCPLLEHNGRPVSSSLIRDYLQSGAIPEATALLNYHFFRRGEVLKGAGRGNRLLYPTANLEASPDLLWPGRGVYLTAVEWEPGKGQLYFGVTNVGGAPTFQRETVAVETHILDFSGNLYGRKLKLYFLEKLREVIAFDTAGSLKDQITDDVQRAGEMVAAAGQQGFRKGFLEMAGSIDC